MTKLYLTWYDCTRCHKLFLSYFEIVDDKDKQFLMRMMDDNKNAGLFDFVIRNARECRICRKGLSLDGWIDIPNEI